MKTERYLAHITFADGTRDARVIAIRYATARGRKRSWRYQTRALLLRLGPDWRAVEWRPVTTVEVR